MTLIRKQADPFRADVLRGERSQYAGEVIEHEDRCEDARRINMGEEDWTDIPCQLPFGHSGKHENGDYEWQA